MYLNDSTRLKLDCFSLCQTVMEHLCQVLSLIFRDANIPEHMENWLGATGLLFWDEGRRMKDKLGNVFLHSISWCVFVLFFEMVGLISFIFSGSVDPFADSSWVIFCVVGILFIFVSSGIGDPKPKPKPTTEPSNTNGPVKTPDGLIREDTLNAARFRKGIIEEDGRGYLGTPERTQMAKYYSWKFKDDEKDL
jgi:hypothetical protein